MSVHLWSQPQQVWSIKILFSGWWLSPTPLKNMTVSWDDYSQYVDKSNHMFSNHQPVLCISIQEATNPNASSMVHIIVGIPRHKISQSLRFFSPCLVRREQITGRGNLSTSKHHKLTGFVLILFKKFASKFVNLKLQSIFQHVSTAL